MIPQFNKVLCLYAFGHGVLIDITFLQQLLDYENYVVERG